MHPSSETLNAETWRTLNARLHDGAVSAGENGSDRWTIVDHGPILVEQFRRAGMAELASQAEAFFAAAIEQGFTNYASAIENARRIKERAALPSRAEIPATAGQTFDEELLAMGVPPRFINPSFAEFARNTDEIDRPMLEVAKTVGGYIKDVRVESALIVSANRGNGKTSLAAIMFRAILSHWRTTTPRVRGIWASVPDVMAAFRAMEGRREDAEDIRIAALQSTPLLVLDDLGQERTSDFAREQFFRLIDHRWSNALPTIVTSNLVTPAAMTQHVGASVFDRLKTYHRIEFKGESQRRAA